MSIFYDHYLLPEKFVIITSDISTAYIELEVAGYANPGARKNATTSSFSLEASVTLQPTKKAA